MQSAGDRAEATQAEATDDYDSEATMPIAASQHTTPDACMTPVSDATTVILSDEDDVREDDLLRRRRRKLAEHESRQSPDVPADHKKVICPGCHAEFSVEEWINCPWPNNCWECHQCCNCAEIAPLDSDDDDDGPCVIPPPPPGTACQCPDHVYRRGRPCPGLHVQPYHDNMVYGAMTAKAVPHVVYLCSECCQSRADRLMAAQPDSGSSRSRPDECYCVDDEATWTAGEDSIAHVAHVCSNSCQSTTDRLMGDDQLVVSGESAPSRADDLDNVHEDLVPDGAAGEAQIPDSPGLGCRCACGCVSPDRNWYTWVCPACAHSADCRSQNRRFGFDWV